MRNLFFGLLSLISFAFTPSEPPIETYHYGHNGMEVIARSKSQTVIISTFNSKMTIRKDIAYELYNLYLENKLESNQKLTVFGCEANVTGKCIIRKKNNLTVVDFYYEVVEWNNGLKEVYQKINT